MTWEKHNVKSWTKTFANFVDLTVDNFNKKRAIL